MMKNKNRLAQMLALTGALFAAQVNADYSGSFLDMRKITVNPGFWHARLETNRLVTVWSDFRKSEETSRIANFENAGKVNAGDASKKGTFKGIPFNDSDVFKIVEGAAYTLATHPDPKLDAYLDDLIAKIASAQEPDGYLYTARTLGYTNSWTGLERWSNIALNHELYNVGHLYEAAVAHYEATGKRTLLEVAMKNADLIARTFGRDEGKLRHVSGHEEIELGLCRLFRATGDENYLRLARELTDLRGRSDLRPLYTSGHDPVPGRYCQDHKPVTRQDEAVGHAVRAAYLYIAMADIAALTGDKDYLAAVTRLWENVVTRKLHLTGGIGARRSGEAFGANYELPNKTAYLETCAAIGQALWSSRMWRLTGEAKYLDVLERTVYNGFLSGYGMSGDEFFYPNPLADDGGYGRSKWFACSCCPVNIVRFIPQIPTYVYGLRDGGLYWNMFMDCEAEVAVGAAALKLAQRTRYPFDGEATLKLSLAQPASFPLRVRIPGWARGECVPGGLYTYVNPADANEIRLTVNGETVKLSITDGYARLDREWRDGDEVRIVLPMRPRLVRAHEAVADDQDRLAVERGPLVYCAEGADNGGKIADVRLRPDEAFTVGETVIGGMTMPTLVARGTTFIPYFAWCHRGTNAMQVWFPEEGKVNPLFTWKGGAFSGDSAERIKLPLPKGVESYTVSAWLKVCGFGPAEAPWPRVFETAAGYLHVLPSGFGLKGKFEFNYGYSVPDGKETRSCAWRSNLPLPTNQWVHVALAAELGGRGAPRLFINGQPLLLEARTELRPKTIGSVLTIGACANGERPFEGLMRDVKFFDRTLSDAEVAALFKETTFPDAVPLLLDDLPVVDISGEKNRHSFVAEGTSEIYQGHPTTCLLPDGKTMFAVWTYNHGGKCGPAAKSTDGGKTWTRMDDRLPAVYKTYANCPSIYAVRRADGGTRLLIAAQGGKGWGLVASDDLGETWWVMPGVAIKNAGMPPTGLLQPKDGEILLFGQQRPEKNLHLGDAPNSDQHVVMVRSTDGGETWSQERIIAAEEGENLCEPFALYSPDRKEICVLMRENRHDGRSKMVFSHDGGATWTAPVDTPWGLTGDRHEGVELQDGRWVIAFRDQALGSSTKYNFVAWVGPYADIKSGRTDRAYRIKLLHSHAKWDCGYSGVELLPDGTVVATTYIKYWNDTRKNSVVSTRFKLSETDARR